MAEVEVSTTPLVVMVEDSPDTRLFIELSSHAADLTEAHHALELAQQEHDPDSMLADATPYLVGFAVVAYGRSILHSNVRGRLTDHVDVREHLTDVHEQIKSFRNATIAHSQSELSVTYPMGFLDMRCSPAHDRRSSTGRRTISTRGRSARVTRRDRPSTGISAQSAPSSRHREGSIAGSLGAQ